MVRIDVVDDVGQPCGVVVSKDLLRSSTWPFTAGSGTMLSADTEKGGEEYRTRRNMGDSVTDMLYVDIRYIDVYETGIRR